MLLARTDETGYYVDCVRALLQSTSEDASHIQPAAHQLSNQVDACNAGKAPARKVNKGTKNDKWIGCDHCPRWYEGLVCITSQTFHYGSHCVFESDRA